MSASILSCSPSRCTPAGACVPVCCSQEKKEEEGKIEEVDEEAEKKEKKKKTVSNSPEPAVLTSAVSLDLIEL